MSLFGIPIHPAISIGEPIKSDNNNTVCNNPSSRHTGARRRCHFLFPNFWCNTTNRHTTCDHGHQQDASSLAIPSRDGNTGDSMISGGISALQLSPKSLETTRNGPYVPQPPTSACRALTKHSCTRHNDVSSALKTEQNARLPREIRFYKHEKSNVVE